MGIPDSKAVLEEYARRQALLRQLDWDKLFFGPQKAFIEDPAQFKVACCSRQSGKTHGSAGALLKAALEMPGSTPIYINLNRTSAQGTIWPALKSIRDSEGLQMEFIRADSSVRLHNGSEIKVYGAGSMREMDKIRGLGASLNLVVLDEAQNFGSDMYILIRQVLLPATVTHKAPILVTGTPNAACAGPFYDIVHGGGEMFKDTSEKGSGWSVHGWTMKDNPHIPDVDEQYERHKAANNWTDASPGFRREYLGEWVRDTEGLCYNLTQSMMVDTFPVGDADDWRYILGVDVGTADPWAFTVLASSRALGQTYVLESYRQEDMSTLQAGGEIERLRDVYPITAIVVDTGGQGANPVRQWKDTHPTIPAEAVKKGYGSVDMGISIINADIAAGKLFFLKDSCGHLIDEAQILIWDQRRSPTGARRVKRGDSYPDHACDSFRYAYTKVRTWGTGAFGYNDMLQPGTPEYADREARRRREKELSTEGRDTRPGWQRVVRKGS